MMLPFFFIFDTFKSRTLRRRIALIVCNSLNPYAKSEGKLLSHSVKEPEILH